MRTRPRPRMIHRVGPDQPWDAAATEWLRAAPEPHAGWSGDVSLLIRAPLPPRLIFHVANMLQIKEMHTWGCDAATVRWVPLEDGGTRLTVAHFKDGAGLFTTTPCPAESRSRAPATHAPHRPRRRATPGAGRLRRAKGGVEGGHGRHLAGPPPPGHRGWVAVGRTSDPRHRAPYVYDDPPHRGTPAWRGMTSTRLSTTTGFSPTTRGQQSGRKRLVGTTDAVSTPACWNSGTPFAKGGTTSGSAVSTPGHRHPTSNTPATSAESVTGCPPPRRRGPTGARSVPRWPRAPGQSHSRSRAGARKRRHFSDASRTRKPPGTAERAPRLPPSCGFTCT